MRALHMGWAVQRWPCGWTTAFFRVLKARKQALMLPQEEACCLVC